MTLVKVADLIGKNIAGVKADLRSRNADGSLMYETQEQPRFVTMTRVYIKRENHHKWMRWEWEKNTEAIPHDCGFSGIRMDSERVGDYHLLMDS